MKYAIVMRPNYNIAFYHTYLDMCKTEIQVMLDAYGLIEKGIEIQTIHKATCLLLEVEDELNKEVLISIYQLSFFYMLYKVVETGYFKPVDIDYTPYFSDDLSTRLKYSGKTNEIITRMMIHIAYHKSAFVGLEKINLMDPLCGRGTTLFEAMINGYNAYGVEKNKQSFQEASTYITRYVKEARLKHVNERGKLIVDGYETGETFHLEYSRDKKEYKNNKRKVLRMFSGDTTRIKGAFKKNSMHLIVVDLPYNIQHKGRLKGDTSPGLEGLLDKGLESWTPFLKKGGTIALSWNVYTDKRERFIEILENYGYEVFNDLNLKHRVAQAITRDIIIARKK